MLTTSFKLSIFENNGNTSLVYLPCKRFLLKYHQTYKQGHESNQYQMYSILHIGYSFRGKCQFYQLIKYIKTFVTQWVHSSVIYINVENCFGILNYLGCNFYFSSRLHNCIHEIRFQVLYKFHRFHMVPLHRCLMLKCK